MILVKIKFIFYKNYFMFKAFLKNVKNFLNYFCLKYNLELFVKKMKDYV